MNLRQKMKFIAIVALNVVFCIYAIHLYFHGIGNPFENDYRLPAESEFNSKNLKIYGYYKVKGESSLVLQDDAGDIYRTSCVKRWIDADCIGAVRLMESKKIKPWNKTNKGKNVRVQLMKVKLPWYIIWIDDFYLIGSIEGDGINSSRDDINKYNMGWYPIASKMTNIFGVIAPVLYALSLFKIISDLIKERRSAESR
ncbi:hypothetical protein [Oleisolibacter albus]|uniref:hypothetical protein n=1 Tax=Oleisolibacter albus TaxID=2171757 RepID=UPI0012D75A50|nr:hypothetical protein [Oleisolibacter albus]